MDSAPYAEVLRRLAANHVEFVVVGLMAGVLRGAPLFTADLDLVHRRTVANVARLLEVLQGLDAIYRHDRRRLRPGESHLMSAGHQLLVTTHGDVDCRGTVGDGRTYELKEQAGQPKDIAALPVLRATLAETLRRS